MQIRTINAEAAPQPVSAYSQAVEVSGATRTLFVSGQLGTEPDTTTPPGIESRRHWHGAILDYSSKPPA